jgi:peptidoglycan/xylan/chitin deacetylase (PgdA/CDA1 family)
MLKPLLTFASPAGPRGRLSVLIFHRVLPEVDPLFPEEMTARRFDAICGWLTQWFNVLPLDTAAAHLKVGTLPARAACITFDDGYADNHNLALPILQRHNLCATFFIATGFLNSGRMWNDTIIETVRRCGDLSCVKAWMPDQGRHDNSAVVPGHDPRSIPPTIADRQATISTLINRIKYLPTQERVDVTEALAKAAGVSPPTNLMMTSAQVKALRHAGMQIGAHTVSHPILARLSNAEASQHIAGSQHYLQDLLGERISLFAYPNGKPGEDYSPATVEVVRSLDFDAAVCTTWGASRMGDDPLQIKRFTPWDKTALRFGLRMLRNF